MKSFIKNNWISLVIIGAVFGWALAQNATLPDRIPSHFDFSGHPDGFQSKSVALFLLPLTSLFVVLLIGSISRLSPGNYKMTESQATAGKFSVGISALFMLLYAAMILEAKSPGAAYFQKLFNPGFALFMIFTGNYFGKLERNFFIGIRVPWTLASETNWLKTHRFAGKMFVAGGLISLAACVFSTATWIPLAILLAVCAASIGYSFWYFSKFENANAAR